MWGEKDIHHGHINRLSFYYLFVDLTEKVGIKTCEVVRILQSAQDVPAGGGGL